MPRPDRRLPALKALEAQSDLQLQINRVGGLNAGLSRVKVSEIVGQMSLYGSFPPAAINVLNMASDAFAAYDELEGTTHP